MGNFTGSQCIICQNTFTDDDDIVVCPDCGTPYHRNCYAQKGRCINTSLHAVGGSWGAVQQETRRRQGGIVCPHCQYVNLADAKTCESCHGSLLSEEEEQKRIRIALPDGSDVYFDAEDPCCGLPPEEKIEEETLGDVANFVRTNTLYYIPLFRRFRDTGRKISLNLSCMLFPNLYFAYRKMWLMAVISSLLIFLCDLPSILIAFVDPDSLRSIKELYGAEGIAMLERLTSFLSANQSFLESLNVPMYIVNLGARLLLCLFGNYLYYRFVMKRVGKIRTNSPTDHVRKSLLHAEGGTSVLNIIGCFGIYYGLMLCFSFVLVLVFIKM
ncbi:MAG: DUF2628 domain-containing protein [Oscillospiraceae bacterium]|nr:DUF2628 domain-containing protein [Oscillospiraceae bacterium]